jgi:hypothetical protein
MTLVFFIIDLTLKPSLHESGADFIESIQTSRTTAADGFFGVFSDLSLGLIYAIPAISYL